MPEAVLASLLQGSTAGQTVGLINLSPYDGCLEKVALRWDQSHPGQMMTTLSLSADLNVAAFSEKQCAFTLLEDLLDQILFRFYFWLLGAVGYSK
jgi:hypothetical protein